MEPSGIRKCTFTLEITESIGSFKAVLQEEILQCPTPYQFFEKGDPGDNQFLDTKPQHEEGTTAKLANREPMETRRNVMGYAFKNQLAEMG